jgi:imipenem/basic amino acid-specific outer membrane pore
MKKTVAGSIALFCAVAAVQGAENLGTMFSEGEVSGQIRAFSISRALGGTADYTRTANAVGGYLKYETAAYEGLSLGAAFYTTNGMFNDDNRSSVEFDPTLLGPGNRSYSYLGEAYVQYKAGNTTLKLGRQRLDTPLAGSDDARMLPNLFEAYLAVNTDLSDTTLIAAHVTQFAQGTFGRTYTSGVLSATSGYSYVDAKNQAGHFVDMGQYAIGAETDGVSLVSATYTGFENVKLQLWDYYAWDILNALYAQADVRWNCLFSDSVKPYAAAQLIQQDAVGDKLAETLSDNATYWAVKAGAKFGNANAYAAYSKNEAGHVITPWGGMPAFTQGMVTRHQFIAEAEAYKVAASYNWKDFGVNLSSAVYYTSFDPVSTCSTTRKRWKTCRSVCAATSRTTTTTVWTGTNTA